MVSNSEPTNNRQKCLLHVKWNGEGSQNNYLAAGQFKMSFVKTTQAFLCGLSCVILTQAQVVGCVCCFSAVRRWKSKQSPQSVSGGTGREVWLGVGRSSCGGLPCGRRTQQGGPQMRRQSLALQAEHQGSSDQRGELKASRESSTLLT